MHHDGRKRVTDDERVDEYVRVFFDCGKFDGHKIWWCPSGPFGD
jgi:hypothetical protein